MLHCAIVTIQEALALGIQHHQAGRLAEAEPLYRQILAAQPNHADALHLLGLVAQQSDRRDIALELISRAIQIHGTAPIFHANLAVVFRSLGLLEDALRCCQRALELEPASAETRKNLALVTAHRKWNAPRADGNPTEEPEALESWLAQAGDIGMLQVPQEIRAFTAFLRTQNLRHVMEIGSHKGGTFFLLCHLARGKKISVDLPGGAFGGLDRADLELRNRAMQTWAPHIHTLLGDSLAPQTHAQVASILGTEPLDLLFIDGNHTYEGVKADFERYRNFVRPGGWIAFHDIVDSAHHRSLGCFVAQLWNELPGEKIEFNANQGWAGIGVLRTPR